MEWQLKNVVFTLYEKPVIKLRQNAKTSKNVRNVIGVLTKEESGEGIIAEALSPVLTPKIILKESHKALIYFSD